MKKLFFILSFFFSLIAQSQIGNPIVHVSNIFSDSLIVSWTKPATADSFVVQRSTDVGFTSPVQVYAGGQQIQYEDGLTPNTDYWYRVKAVRKSDDLESGWVGVQTKTFWSPSATSEGGNRVAVQADVDNTTLNPDGILNVGDYLYVGYNGTGGYTVAGSYFQWGKTLYLQTPPALAAGKKICIVGGRGYDYVEINMKNNSGADSSNRVVITNISGQAKMGQLRLTNCRHVIVTGKYSATNKTGSSEYLGFDMPDWTNLYGSFGIYVQSTWGQRGASVIGLSGDCEDVVFEGIQAGEGGFASIVDKNDSYHPTDLSITSTGSLSTYATTTQALSGGTSWLWSSERIRITLNTVTSVNIDSIYFVGTGTTTGTYIFQAEVYDGSNHLTNNGSSVTLATTSTSDKAFVDIKLDSLPQGTYDYKLVMSNTVTASISNQIASMPLNGLTIRDNYFADGGSEGIYSGSTQAHPTQAIKNVIIENCIYARNGGNSTQIGQNKDSAIIRNNVLISGGYEWSNSFQKFQDQAIQFGHRQNRISFENNLIVGSNGTPFNFSINPTAYDTVYDTDTANIINNAILNIRDYNGGYMNSNNHGKGTIMLQNNYWGRFGNGSYEKLYNTNIDSFVVLLGTDGGDGTITMRAQNNYYDASIATGGSFIELNQASDPNVTLTDASNTRQSTVPYPKFKNYCDKDSTYDYANEETWTDYFSPQWNSTNKSGTKFDSAATAQSTTLDLATIRRIYNLNDVVRHNGLFYKSLVSNNTGHQPTGYTDAYWELIVFSNGSVMPIDDVRQEANSFYAIKKMGLTQTFTNVSVFPHIKIKKGSRIKLIQL